MKLQVPLIWTAIACLDAYEKIQQQDEEYEQ